MRRFVVGLLLVFFLVGVFGLESDSADVSSTVDDTQKSLTTGSLDEDGEAALKVVRDFSDASTGFFKDSGAEVWGSLKESVKDPMGTLKDVYSGIENKTGQFFGLNDSEGNSIILWSYFFGVDFANFFVIAMGIAIFSMFITVNTRSHWVRNFFSLFGVFFFISAFIFSWFNETPFWEDFAFLMIVSVYYLVIYLAAMFGVFYGSDFVYQMSLGRSYLGYAISQSWKKSHAVTLIVFAVVYILFNAILILNTGIYVLSLEFLGYNNGFFQYFIRPLIIALLLYFGEDILKAWAEKNDSDEKFKDKLREQAIREMNVNELRS